MQAASLCHTAQNASARRFLRQLVLLSGQSLCHERGWIKYLAMRKGPVFRDSSSTNRTGENGLLCSEERYCPGFSLDGQTQPGFEESMRRMRCDQKQNVVASESQQDHRITSPPLSFPQASWGLDITNSQDFPAGSGLSTSINRCVSVIRDWQRGCNVKGQIVCIEFQLSKREKS